MERAHPHAGWLFCQHLPDAVAHLTGSFVGERDSKNAGRVYTMVLDHVNDARGEHTRLARARSRQREDRPFEMLNGRTLFGVQAFQILHCLFGEYASMRVCEYASMRVCEYANRNYEITKLRTYEMAHIRIFAYSHIRILA